MPSHPLKQNGLGNKAFPLACTTLPEGHAFKRARKSRAAGATALPKARSEGAAATTELPSSTCADRALLRAQSANRRWYFPTRTARAHARVPMPFSALVCLYLPFSASICSCLPLSALVCLYLLLSASICPSLPLSALLCLYPPLHRQPHPQHRRLIKVPSHHLHPDRQTFLRLPARHTHPADPRQARRHRINILEIHLQRIVGLLPSLNAGVGVTGEINTSHSANAARKSRVSSVRTCCAFL